MVIRKGSIYWVNFSPGKGSEPMGRRPGLVLQQDTLNDSRISTVLMAALTSTMKFGELPGNVTLRKGESNMPRGCVINVTQIKAVDKNAIGDLIGALSTRRLHEVYAGILLVMGMDDEEIG